MTVNRVFSANVTVKIVTIVHKTVTKIKSREE
jgi:hypothetical protein